MVKRVPSKIAISGVRQAVEHTRVLQIAARFAPHAALVGVRKRILVAVRDHMPQKQEETTKWHGNPSD